MARAKKSQTAVWEPSDKKYTDDSISGCSNPSPLELVVYQVSKYTDPLSVECNQVTQDYHWYFTRILM